MRRFLCTRVHPPVVVVVVVVVVLVVVAHSLPIAGGLSSEEALLQWLDVRRPKASRFGVTIFLDGFMCGLFTLLDGGFKYLLFSPLLGEMIQFG